MIDAVRIFLVVVEEGSLNRAAARLRTSQSSLTRKLQALEADFGGPLVERLSSGVRPTALGHLVIERLKPIVLNWDAALVEVRNHALGESPQIRIGFIGSAANAYLTPAFSRLRKHHPGLRPQLFDYSPGEQIAALESGRIDIALIGQEGAHLADRYFARTIARLGVCAVLPLDHAAAEAARVPLRALAGDRFIGYPEDQVPGRNRWIRDMLRSVGAKPLFIAEADSIQEVFSLVAATGAVTLLPDYFIDLQHPGVACLPVEDEVAAWDFLVLWQPGKFTGLLKGLVDALVEVAPKVVADRRGKPGTPPH